MLPVLYAIRTISTTISNTNLNVNCVNVLLFEFFCVIVVVVVIVVVDEIIYRLVQDRNEMSIY